MESSGWFQKLLNPKISLSTHRGQKGKATTSLSDAAPPRAQKPPPALSSIQRWTRKFDLLVCHSLADSDTKEATRLVSFLEASPRGLRCFLWQRDVCPGGAIFTEFCQAVKESHLQALLITPHFLQEEWCMYMMHQVLAEGPKSGRLIPLIWNLSHPEYPPELKFYFYINLSSNADQGYSLINKTVLTGLENLVRNERTFDSRPGTSGAGGSRGDEPVSSDDPAETPRRSDAEEE